MSEGRTSTSVRTIVIASFLFLTVYLIGFSAYLVLRISPAAAALERETMPVLGVFESITGRMARLDELLRVAHVAMDRQLRPDMLVSRRGLPRVNANRAMPAPFLALRVACARQDGCRSRRCRPARNDRSATASAGVPPTRDR